MRLVWPDLARGLAVLSMLIAHVAPGGGVPVLSEFLTAALFACLVFVSLALSWFNRKVSFGRWAIIQGMRGVILVVVGELLQPLYAQIVVVLQALGLLTVVGAVLVPLVAKRPRVALGLALVLSVASPVVMDGARSLPVSSPFLAWWVDLLFTGTSYRLSTFLVFGLVGVVLLGLIRSNAWSTRRGILFAAGVTVTAVLVLAADQLTAQRLDPYSGSTLEILFNSLLVAVVVLWSAVLESRFGSDRTDRFLAPVTATGRMAFTAYVLQILILALTVRLFLNGGRDDSWIVLGALTVLIVGFCWLWERLGWPRPLESLLRLPQLLLQPRTANDLGTAGSKRRV